MIERTENYLKKGRFMKKFLSRKVWRLFLAKLIPKTLSVAAMTDEIDNYIFVWESTKYSQNTFTGQELKGILHYTQNNNWT